MSERTRGSYALVAQYAGRESPLRLIDPDSGRVFIERGSMVPPLADEAWHRRAEQICRRLDEREENE